MEQGVLLGLGRAIRAQRVALGFSQEGFADHIGMHRAYYGAIERGTKNITVATLLRLCEALERSPSRIFADAGQ